MLKTTAKSILIAAAALAVCAVPQESRADREWFWGDGHFFPEPSRRTALPEPRSTDGPSQIRRRTENRTTERSGKATFNGDIRKQQADLRKQQAELEKREAELERRQAILRQDQAKLRQRTAALASAPAEASITCDAARAVVVDFGFKDVRPELCAGKRLKFGAIRDGKRFSIEVAANGELTKVERLP
jgi:hypothetical protein